MYSYNIKTYGGGEDYESKYIGPKQIYWPPAMGAKHNTQIPGPAIYTENPDSHLTQEFFFGVENRENIFVLLGNNNATK